MMMATTIASMEILREILLPDIWTPIPGIRGDQTP
jgi:hypothetical protein